MTNVFESGARKCVPAVLVYARQSESDGERVLMIHRNSERPGDYHSGKWNGLGGKLEADESPLEAAQREFHEESGVHLMDARFRPLGTLTFPNFKAHKSEDWIVFVFEAALSEDEAKQVVYESEEGQLHWVPRKDLTTLNLWPGDRYFIPHVAASEPFTGTIWYDGPKVTRHWVQRL